MTVIAGAGGDGFVSFRREKYIAHGNPDGGDGGRGGHVVLKVNENLNTLYHLRNRRVYKGESGVGGHRSDRAGRRGEDLVLEVPPGTLVYSQETEELLSDLVEPGAEYVVAHGGKGGFGNAHFTSSTRQAPNFAEKGEPGEQKDIRLEMQLVADVGIIGLPSVGKSTLISRITNSKPKIAAYHFTTLIPNMGVVDMGEFGGSPGQTFVVADVPGLIEGAHEGKGLGHEFLRHVSRTAILVHVLDCQSQDMAKDWKVIMDELIAYDEELSKRPQILVINKVDTIDEEMREFLKGELESFLSEYGMEVEIFMISSVAGEGLKPLLFNLLEKVQAFKADQRAKAPAAGEEGYRVFKPHLEKDLGGFEIERTEEGFVVKGKRIEQIVVMTDLENKSAVMRVYDVLEKMSIMKKIRAQEPELGTPIRIGEAVFEFRG